MYKDVFRNPQLVRSSARVLICLYAIACLSGCSTESPEHSTPIATNPELSSASWKLDINRILGTDVYLSLTNRSQVDRIAYKPTVGLTLEIEIQPPLQHSGDIVDPVVGEQWLETVPPGKELVVKVSVDDLVSGEVAPDCDYQMVVVYDDGPLNSRRYNRLSGTSSVGRVTSPVLRVSVRLGKVVGVVP